ncbi:hypothetical protein E4S40_03750 [Algoriphagus kandeliae]|uniref:HEAT repeat domain-containing protein n=1 Tax=Algoriphagus kandeliae TaxID=2562278 RepID=A0A4Y9QYZ5_9BACT|nr:hypothetical protein [Algoriphagus kandeliae]TFV97764.1 hypothetical protein E4S40_03750 [Algoriphagus kandeliae]
MSRKLFHIFCFWISGFSAFAQSYDSLFTSEDQLVSELVQHQEINSLKYRFLFADSPKSIDSLAEQGVNFESVGSDYYSEIFSDWSKLDSIQQVFQGSELEFLIYDEPSDFQGVITYLETLNSTGDFVLASAMASSNENIILEAVSSHYQAQEDYKSWLSSDWKFSAVLITIFLFLLGSVGMVLFLLILKSKRNREEELQKVYDELVVDPLTSLLFEKDLAELQAIGSEELKSFFPNAPFQKPLFRQVLINRIIGLNKKMKGDFKDKLKHIYKKLKLTDDTKRLLGSKKWSDVTTGIVQVNEMDLVEFLLDVKKHTNSPNFQVRNQAGATLLNLSENVDLTFLKEQTYPLSEWQQMHYLRIIKYVQSSKALKISLLFQSENQSVREFGVKLVKILGRLDLLEDLRELTKRASPEEIVEVLNTYGALGAHMEIDFINSCLKSDNSEIRDMAISVSANLGNEESEKILIELLSSNPEIPLRKHLLSSLFRLNQQVFEEYITTNYQAENQAIKKELIDPILQHV